MIFCRKKTEKLEAFRVGYHAIPEWLKKELDAGYDEVKGIRRGRSIEVHNDAEGKPEIMIELPHLVAINGDWIVKEADGQLMKYKHEQFSKMFEKWEE